jgi:hypothetical protein
MCVQYFIHVLQATMNSVPSEGSKVLLPLISSLIGGALVLVGQVIMGIIKRRDDDKVELRSIIASFEKKQALLYFSLKDFAFYKLCFSYFTYKYEQKKNDYIENNETEEVAEKRSLFFLDEHLKNQERLFATELIINNLMSDLVEIIGKVESIRPGWASYSSHLKKIKTTEFRLPNEYEFDSENFEFVIDDQFLYDQILFTNEYRKNVAFLDGIVHEMKNR